MDRIEIAADGAEFIVEGHTTGDIRLLVKVGEWDAVEAYLLPATAAVLGEALVAIARKDPKA
jgi:hypothetical protein